MSTPVSIKVENGIAWLSLANPPVNALSAAVRTGLRDGASTLGARKDLRAVILMGDGRAFSAGADISEFGTEPPAGTPTLPETIEAIENLPIPVIAAVHGFAFGGGLELAMGAHYRISVPGTKMGLTEVDLGIIPGAGGTQRLPRLVAFETAVRMIAGAERIEAAEAHAIGLVDELVEGDLAAAALDYVERLLKSGGGPRPTSARTVDADLAAIEAARAKLPKDRIAPGRALDAITNATTLPFAEGMKAERAIFLELRDGPEARAMREKFKAERAAKKSGGA